MKICDKGMTLLVITFTALLLLAIAVAPYNLLAQGEPEKKFLVRVFQDKLASFSLSAIQEFTKLLDLYTT